MTTHTICKQTKLCQCGCGRISDAPHIIREIQSQGATDISVPTVYAPECCPECKEVPNAS